MANRPTLTKKTFIDWPSTTTKVMAEDLNGIEDAIQVNEKMGTVNTFDIATSDWVANTGDTVHPYKAVKESEFYYDDSTPVWCFASTSTTAGDTDLTQTDTAMSELVDKAEFTSSNVTFYATAQVTSSVKISVKGV